MFNIFKGKKELIEEIDKKNKEIDKLERISGLRASQVRDFESKLETSRQSIVEMHNKDWEKTQKHAEEIKELQKENEEKIQRREETIKDQRYKLIILEKERNKYKEELEGEREGLFERYEKIKADLTELAGADRRAQFFEDICKRVAVELAYLKKYNTDPSVLGIADKLIEMLDGYTGVPMVEPARERHEAHIVTDDVPDHYVRTTKTWKP